MALVPVGQQLRYVDGEMRLVQVYWDDVSGGETYGPPEGVQDEQFDSGGVDAGGTLENTPTMPTWGAPAQDIPTAQMPTPPTTRTPTAMGAPPVTRAPTLNYPGAGTGHEGGAYGGGQFGGTGGMMADPNRYLNQGIPGNQGITGPGQIPGAVQNQGMAAAQLPAGGAGINTGFQGGGGGVSDPNFMRGNLLYSPDNPVSALNNALRDRGINPFNAGNPFVQFIQRAAPGLAAAFYIQNALGGQTGADVAQNPMAFQGYLGNALQSGNVFSGLANASRQLPGIINAIRGIGEGTDITQVNPFLQALNTMLGRNFGEGTLDVMSALLGPGMPRSLGQGYRSGLEAALSTAQYRFPFEDQNADIWQSLFGNQVGPNRRGPQAGLGAPDRPLIGTLGGFSGFGGVGAP